MLLKQFTYMILVLLLGGSFTSSAASTIPGARIGASDLRWPILVLPRTTLPCPPPPPDDSVPVPPGCRKNHATVSPINICLRLTATPSIAIHPEVVSYRLVVRNTGRGDINGIRITLPITRDIQTALDATFTSPTAWVSAVREQEIELLLEQLARDQTFTATLQLRTNPAVQPGSILSTRAYMEWSDAGRGGMSRSNRLTLTVGASVAGNSAAQLEIMPADPPPATTSAITFDGFASHEIVGLWYHHLDGGVVGLGEVRADAQGRLVYNLVATNFSAGRYMLVAHGHCSRVSATGTFVVRAPE